MHTHTCTCTYATHTHTHTHTQRLPTVMLTICKIDNNKKNIQYTIQSHSTIYYF